MRLRASLPPGAAIILLCSCLLILLHECRAEVGGRQIRRITAADLPSSNSTDVTKTKLKKVQSINKLNCTLTGSCKNSTPSSSSSSSSTESLDGSTKVVSSFVANDVLRGRLHLTTTSPTYAENFESFFDDSNISFDDDYENKTNYFPREVSGFRDHNHTVTEVSNYGASLTTPRISIFDDFHDRLTEGIQQNLDTDERIFRNTERTQGAKIPKYEHGDDSTKNEHESVALEFSKNLSLVYNDSSSPISVSRNVVIENGTRVNFEKSSIHTEVEPEFNKTIVYYFTNESYSTELPETEQTPTVDSGNIDINLQSVSNETLSKQSILDKSKSDQRSSTNRNASSAKNVIIKNTGTPGDKESTISEPTRGRSYNRSQEQISNKINDNNLSETTAINNTNNLKTSTPKGIEVSDSVAETSSNNSTKITKDLKSNKLAYTGKIPSNTNNSRNGKMLILNRNQNSGNSTDGLGESSETPQMGSSENSLTRDQIKKFKPRSGLRRTGHNRTEEQVVANTTEESEYSTVLSQKPDETVTTTEDSLTSTESEDYTSTEYSTSSRSRAFTFRRIYSGTSTSVPVTDGIRETSERTYTTIKPNNFEAVRQRLSTMKRRPQTSTEPNYTVVSSSNFTTESNAIVRGWPGIPRRPVVPKLSPNGTLTDVTENNEGNDIIASRTNTYKPINRNRGSVRYGSPKNSTLGSESSVNESSFPLPPSATAWTLVTLKGRRNESRSSQQPIQNNTSTVNSTTSTRWSPVRGKRPWSTSEAAITTASENETSEPFSTTSKPTRLRPVTDKRLTNRTSSVKLVQSSMQENRLSQVHITAPITEQSDDMTEDSITTTTSASEDEFSTTTMFSQSTSVDSDITTTSDTVSTFETSVINIQSDSLITTESEMDDVTTANAETTSEILDSTTSNPETTISEIATTTLSDVTTTDFSTEYDSTTVSTVPNEANQGGFQEVPNSIPASTEIPQIGPTSTEIPQIGPFEEENDQQQPDTPEAESGSNAGVYPDVSNPGEEIKTGNNPVSGQMDEGNKQGTGEEMRPDGINIESQGDLPQSSGDEGEENKNSEGKIYDSQNPGEKFQPGGDEQEDPVDDNAQENSPLELKTEAVPPIAISVTPKTSSAAYETQSRTTTSPGTEPTATASWSSSSISAVEWDSSEMKKQEDINHSLYLRLNIQATWEDFCSGIEEFRTEVADIMTNNNSPISKDQVVLDSERCMESQVRYARSTEIEVPMYLVGSDKKLDLKLTKHFLELWTQGKISEINSFKITGVNVVQSPQAKAGDGSTQDGVTGIQTSTSDSSSEGGGPGMIAAITISCIGAVCLLLIAILWIVMRKRQQKFNYGQRCTPVSLDAYSLDSVSVCGSVRRKGVVRNSKRSYGNAGFEDPAIPTHPMGFAGLANFITNRQSVEEEFANIPHVTANVDEIPEGADAKNRYANVIPLPETRVQLTPVEGEPLSEYINANFVHGPKGVNKYYIACQAPLNTTVNDFWRMIWEQQSKVILMLTDLVENGVEKCADYLPPSEVLDCHRLFGDFQITLKKREVKEKYIISTLQLKNLETNSWREVMHLWYVSWPTQGVPDDPSSVIAFLLEARPYMRSGPCVVHCSPGTGRTGTVIASDLCIRDFETTRIVDIPRCVAQLRRGRAGSVQTRDQYFFIYQVINLYGAKLTGSALDSM